MTKTIIYTILSRGATAIALLINLVLISRFLGSEILGQLSLLILDMAIIHAIAEIYAGSSMVFFIPRVNFRSLYIRGFFWVLMAVIIFSFLFYFFTPLIRPLWIHLLVLALFSAIHNFHVFLLLGRENIRAYNILVIFQPVSSVLTLSFCLFALNMRTIEASLLALYLSFIGSVILSSFFIIKSKKDSAKEQKPQWSAMLQRGFINQVANLSHILSNRYNYYIIAGFGLGLLGVYSSGTSLIESVWTVSAAISPLVLARVANSGNSAEGAGLSWRMAKLSFLLSSAAVLVLLFIPSSVFTSILGKDFTEVKSVMLWLSPGVLALSFSSVLSHYYGGLGQQRILLNANLGGLLITLMSSYFLISQWGLKGACAAASLAYLVQCIILTWTFTKEQGLKWKDLMTW